MAKKQPRFWGSTARPVMQQHMRMQARFPQFRMRGRPPKVEWRGSLRPRTEQEYEVLIRYREKQSPCVYLLDPEVRADCPHIYKSDENRLCIYWPRDPDNPPWQADSWIADTIIPWTSSWLYFYELWLETGEWLGPEKTHAGEK